MSLPRKKKTSRKDQEQKIQYNSILSVPLHLVNQKDLTTQEILSSDYFDNNFPAGGRRSTDVHVVGHLERWEKLSAREKHVTYLVCKRKRNDEIATEMGVTVGTVNSYLNHIYNKLDIRSKMDLFHMFYNFDFRNNPPY
jgi:DNA-binding CsgD family transcriptional regulator